MPYGIRLLECLLASGCRVQLLYSQVAQIVARQEMDLELPARASEVQIFFRQRFAELPGSLEVYGREEWFAPVASGSNPPDAMIVCPCTMGTLASIAQGLASNLIERAADVVLKEGRKLVLVPRETPFSAIHLENMLRLSRAGAVIFYVELHRSAQLGDGSHFGGNGKHRAERCELDVLPDELVPDCNARGAVLVSLGSDRHRMGSARNGAQAIFASVVRGVGPWGDVVLHSQ